MQNLIDNEKKEFNRSIERFIIILLCIVCAILIIRIGFMGAYTPYVVEGESMESTLHSGDYVYVINNAKPKRGDIVTIMTDEKLENSDEYKVIIKRVIAFGGETVEIKDGKLYIDDKLFDEPYLADSAPDKNPFEKITVPSGTLFCMGDNRNNSSDSRNHYGPISESKVIGVVADWSLSMKDFITKVNVFLQ